MPTYHSQYGQDRLLDRHVFGGMRGGVFVDVGAHDGVSISNTLTFEADYGWSGVCIEANPEIFPRLLENRRATCLNVAVASERGRMPFYQVSGAPQMLSGLVAASADWHRARVEHELARDGGTLQIIEVPTRRLDEVFDEFALSEVHLLSIDTEGNEAEIIGTIDHDKTTVHVIDAECNTRADLPALRAAAGPLFKFVGRYHGDALFVNRRSSFAAAHSALRRAMRAERMDRRVARLRRRLDAIFHRVS